MQKIKLFVDEIFITQILDMLFSIPKQSSHKLGLVELVELVACDYPHILLRLIGTTNIQKLKIEHDKMKEGKIIIN